MGRVRVRVRETDRGWRKFVRAVKESEVTITVGVQGANAAIPHVDSELTVAQVGAFNEFGFGVPERSFLRETIDTNRSKYVKLLRGLAAAIVNGTVKAEVGAALIGEIVVGDIKQRIANRIPPPNAPETIERKGSSVPLIDQGQLRGSMTKAVHKGRIRREGSGAG